MSLQNNTCTLMRYNVSVICLIYCFLGPVERKVNSAVHQLVIFSTVVKMLEKL